MREFVSSSAQVAEQGCNSQTFSAYPASGRFEQNIIDAAAVQSATWQPSIQPYAVLVSGKEQDQGSILYSPVTL